MEKLGEQLSGFKVIIFCGLPGSGKTTYARAVCKKINAKYFSTDQIRTRELFVKTGRFDRGKSSQEYHVKVVRKKIYEEMTRRAIKFVKDEFQVVLDGTFFWMR